MANLRALIVDDEPIAREGMRLHLEADSGVDVIGEAGDGSTAVDIVRELRPDIVFLDVQMPGLDGFDVIDQLEHDAGAIASASGSWSGPPDPPPGPRPACTACAVASSRAQD